MSKRKRGHGEGSIRQRGKRWEAAVMIGDRRRTATFATRGKASGWVARTRADADRGLLQDEPKPARVLFDDACRALKVSKTGPLASKRWRPGTVRFFDHHATSVLVPFFGGRFLDEITPELIEEFKRRRHETGVSPATINLHLQVLRQVFNYAVRKRLLKWSPMAAVDRVDTEEHDRKRRERQRILAAHEIRAFLEALPDAEQRAFFTVLFFCGLRRGEILRMEWSWVDFADRMLHVKIAKRGSSRIPMSPQVVAALKELGAPQPAGPVFPPRRRSAGWRAAREAGATVERGGMRQALAAGLRTAGIDPTGVGFHAFRHSFLSLVERLPGVSYSIVRDLARHGATSVTDRYISTHWEGLRHALADLEAAVYGSNVRVFPKVAI